MAEIQVLEASPIFSVPAGEAIKRGALVYYSQTNSDYRNAEADGAAEVGVFQFAEFVALSSAAADGDTLLVAKAATLRDSDNNSFSSTVGSALYLSGTAGGYTGTRPTGANDLKQRVGHAYGEVGGTGAQIAVISLERREETFTLTPISDGLSAGLQNEDYTGLVLSAGAAAAGFGFEMPGNATGRLVFARLWWTSNAALDTNDTYTVDVSAGVNSATTTAASDGISAAAMTITDGDIASATITDGFGNAAGDGGHDILEPGNFIAIDVDKAAEGSSGDDPIILGFVLTIETC